MNGVSEDRGLRDPEEKREEGRVGNERGERGKVRRQEKSVVVYTLLNREDTSSTCTPCIDGETRSRRGLEDSQH
jgi:hypothetical protein